MKHLLTILLFLPFTLFGQSLYEIPKGEGQVFRLIGDSSESNIVDFVEFEISNEISLNQYFDFVADQKQISLNVDFPFMLLKDLQERDSFPAIAVSWHDAMEYCKWLTLKSQDMDSIRYIYRLPTLSEWLYVYGLQNIQGLTNLDESVSEWTLNSKDEAFYNPTYKWEDYIYFAKQNDPRVLKRKIAIGNSWLFKTNDLSKYIAYDYYENNRYGHVGFRIVKINFNENSTSADKQLVEIWTKEK